MLLTDGQILKAISLGEMAITDPAFVVGGTVVRQPTPLGDGTALQPASVDLRLGDELLVPPMRALCSVVAISGRREALPLVTRDADRFVLSPGQFVLATTQECVTLGPRHWARVEGKSSIGRLGLSVHVTAGFIDPGFTGQITLELVNHAPYPIELVAGAYICQICFGHLSERPNRIYGAPGLGSHYQHQRGVQGAK